MNNPCQNSSNFSHLSLNSNSVQSCHSSEVISGHSPTSFKSNSPLNVNNSLNEDVMEAVDCPYKSFIDNDVQVDLFNTEEHDFKSPKLFSNLKQNSQNKFNYKHCKSTGRNSRIKNKKHCDSEKKTNRTRQTILTKKIVAGLHGGDINPDHLQLAIALSKSEHEQQETYEAVDPNKPTISQTLEKFCFTGAAKKIGVTHRAPVGVIHRAPVGVKRKKTSKFKYVTPILFLRTEADRLQLISEKVALILSENYNTADNFTHNCDQTVYSDSLHKYWCRNADIFNMNSTDFTNLLSNDVFYVKALPSISPSSSKCGSLLRDWNLIPDRPLTPIPKEDVSFNNISEIDNKSSPILKSDFTNMNRCISPDLFQSDDEECYAESNCLMQSTELLKSNLQSSHLELHDDGNINVHSTPKNTSQSNMFQKDFETFLTNVSHKKESNGIFALESYAENEQELAKTCFNLEHRIDCEIDLTQSSDDDLESSVSPSKSLDLHNSQGTRRSSSLNVTDYVYSVLNQEPETTSKKVLLDCQKEINYDSVDYNVSNSKLNESLCLNNDDTIIITEEKLDLPIQTSSITQEKMSVMGLKPSLGNLHQVESSHTKNNESECSTYTHNVTPKNKVTIKTINVTPMANYNDMSTPSIQRELMKFGLKPFKRRKGVQLLHHIYEMTHPIGTQIETLSDDEDARMHKRKKNENSTEKKRTLKKHKSEPYIKPSYSTKKTNFNVNHEVLTEEITLDSTQLQSSGTHKIEIGEIHYEEPDDLVFETIQSKKVLSCRIPFHIVFHNLVSANPGLREKILLFEPIMLAELYKNVQDLGYRFNVKDIENFLHKKCITIKTNQTHHFERRKKKPHSMKKFN